MSDLRISKYLMQNRGFNIILCESDWTFMWHVNQYVHRPLGFSFGFCEVEVKRLPIAVGVTPLT